MPTTTDVIPSGEVLTYYKGDMIPRAEADRRRAAEQAPAVELIPHQLHECRFVLIKKKSKVAFEKGWSDTKNYAFDDAILTQHIAKNKNYGVKTAGGMCIFDCDNVLALTTNPFFIDVLLETFAVRTGRDKDKKTGEPRAGCHFYFRCPELPSDKFALEKDGVEMGDIRGPDSPFYVVGPGSIHPDTLKTYEVINDAEPITVDYDLLMEFINSMIPEEKPAKPISFPKIPSAGGTIADRLGLNVVDFLMPENPHPREHQVEGNHPVHGGNTGTNLILDPVANNWYCRHCHSGGGPLEALAVADGILDCSYFRKGNAGLEGHWPAIFDALKKRGYTEQLAEMDRERSRTTSSTAPPNKPQHMESDTPRELPKIKTNNRHLHELSTDAIRAILEANVDPFMFRRGSHLVRIERDEHGRSTIREINEHALRGILDRCAIWYSAQRRQDKDTGTFVFEEHPENPPVTVVRDLLNLPGSAWKVPSLVGISLCPTIHPDGTVHAIEGYDPVTRTYFAPEEGFKIPQIPENPSETDVQHALETITEVFVDFPFCDEAGLWNTVGALLTGVLRPLIDGPCPCWVVDKPQAGAGASLLQGVVYAAITGEELAAGTAPKSNEEWSKRILAALLSGRPVQVLDNIDGPFKSDAFASVLTAREVRGRILGRSEEATVPARAFWMANGNNIQIGGDLGRRIFLTRIDPKMAIPWQRSGFQHPDIVRWVQEGRGSLVAAVLTLTKAWQQADAPKPEKIPPVGGFESWRDTVGGILEHAGVTEFLGNAMKVYLTADAELQQWEGFLQAISGVFCGEPWTVADIRMRLDREDAGQVHFDTRIIDTLPDRLADAYVDSGQSFPKICGRGLSRQDGRRFPSGLMLQKGQTIHSAKQWVVISTKSADHNSPEVGA